MKWVDLRKWLPRRKDNDPEPIGPYDKNSITVHYQGLEVLREMTDADAKQLVMSDALEHIHRDWSREIPGVQGGGGVMYHLMIAPSGTVFQCRDLGDYLWHCGNEYGNIHSIAVQVMCGPTTPPTDAQFTSLDKLLDELMLKDPRLRAIYPHQFWSPTSCPGHVLVTYVEEENMYTDADRKRDEQTATDAKVARDLIEARESLVWIARAQRGLDVERKDTPFAKTNAPLDKRI